MYIIKSIYSWMKQYSYTAHIDECFLASRESSHVLELLVHSEQELYWWSILWSFLRSASKISSSQPFVFFVNISVNVLIPVLFMLEKYLVECILRENIKIAKFFAIKFSKKCLSPTSAEILSFRPGRSLVAIWSHQIRSICTYFSIE